MSKQRTMAYADHTFGLCLHFGVHEVELMVRTDFYSISRLCRKVSFGYKKNMGEITESSDV
jgi:hypothetical protein